MQFHDADPESQSNWTTRRLVTEAFMLLLAFVSIVLLVVEITATLEPRERQLIIHVDTAIALLFLVDFVTRFYSSPNRAAFFRRYWWELLAAIPVTSEMTQALRSVRLLRVLRFLRVLRIIRLGARIHRLVERSRSFERHTGVVFLSVVVGVIVSAGAFAFYYTESGVNENVQGLGDAYWWAFSTVTTVGYGDIYPVTSAGRVIAVLLMLTGIGSLGAYIGVITKYIARTPPE